MNTPSLPLQFKNSSSLLKGRHILIVDDTPVNLKVLSRILTDNGIEVAVAINGKMALQQVEYEPPELILLDILMPGMDGFETCKKLKLNPATYDIPVIFTTALSETADKVKGFSLGAVDYITKPFQEEEVLARVQVHLQLRTLSKMIEERNRELEEVIKQLQTTQQRLIIQEKLATIGTLIAGVSHELRNPLNFINNYAESSAEMSDDILDELNTQAENIEPESLKYIQEILSELRENSVIIQQNGQRAENVIQSMLLQARTDSSNREITDINQLTDQALQLAWKSFRGNNNNFSVSIKTEYDQTIQPFLIIPGNVLRALINIIDNACYTLQQKYEYKKQIGEKFKPQLKITTRNQSNAVEVRIWDNGLGISEEIREKIFQPFLTTKSVGQGTGLGLALTQDIITGQHGGTLEVNTEVGVYTEFIIILPTHNHT
ncbi:MAG: response regulator [Cyanobacteriota bacterium]|nr:response regulator [Cyanobacteriota bacterium]